MEKNKNIGTVFHNSNGVDYWIIYQNFELDRTLLLDPHTKQYIGAWNICLSKGCWSQGHYFMKDFESAVNYVFGKEVN